MAHYVVTAHPPGGVLLTAKCNFTAPNATDVIIAKSRRLEIRQASNDANSPFPIILQVPVNGRVTSLLPLKVPLSPTSYLFITTDRFRYAVIGFDPTRQPHPIATHASGTFKQFDQGVIGREAECAPLVALDPHSRCLALHLYDGLITILPINFGYSPPKAALKGGAAPRTHQSHVLLDAYHARIEERTLLDICFLYASVEQFPQICLLHQDSRGLQHLISHTVDLSKKQLVFSTDSLKKSRMDGGSSLIIPVPPVSLAAASATTTATSTTLGGVLVLGQRQITFLQTGLSRVIPLPSCLLLTWEKLPTLQGCPRYLLSDEFGNLLMLSLTIVGDKISGISLDTLGSCVIASALTYITDGLCFVGSSFGDSQLVQIMDQPMPIGEGTSDLEETTYLSVVEEYTNLGPIVDFDLVPTPGSRQSQVVTASGSSNSGSLRLVRNGIGMNEYASVEIPGIQSMWSVRKAWKETDDAYLVQSFVRDTRVLGVAAAGKIDDEEGEEPDCTLEEVIISGLDSTSSSLYVGNVQVGDTIVQITETEVRILEASSLQCSETWAPQVDDFLQNQSRSITVASANEAGQIVVALRGGLVIYLRVKADGTGSIKLEVMRKLQMEREVSCLNLNPFADATAMEVDVDKADAAISSLVCIGLWDDFTVRVLSLEEDLKEVLQINLSTDEDETEESESIIPVRRNRNNMMARSLCFVTLDSSTSSSSGTTSFGVNMLFVGLGDGTLISFAVVDYNGQIKVQSKKEVNLGTQRINLITLQTERGGTCILATGDRPTVVYLAGGGKSSGNFTPKLCYSNVNLSASDGEEDNVSRPPAQQSISINVATPFFSPQLFDESSLGSKRYSLCVSDDSILRLGVIDDIQKLHVTTCRLGMAPRRVVHCSEGRLFAVGCIESGIKQGGGPANGQNIGNCIRFMDDTTFDDIERIDLEPYEMILSMVYANLTMTGTGVKEDVKTIDSKDDSSNDSVVKPYLLVGTAYALPDEDEPTRGRILLFSCDDDGNMNARAVRLVTELQVRGGVYSMCQFYNGLIVATVNSKTHVVKLTNDGGGISKLNFVGVGHHGHILSLFVKCKAIKEEPVESEAVNLDDTPMKKKATKDDMEQLVIVGDLMRSISLVQYFPEHQALEEVARDFNANWTTAVEMLSDSIYLGSENWNNLFVLRRNAKAASEEVRCRLDTIGEFHLGEMCNKFMCGSLVMPHTSSTSASASASGKPSSRTRKSASSPATKTKKESKTAAGSRARRPNVSIGSQTLFATVDGTLGSILGIDARTAAFFTTLERAMARTIPPVGDFSHEEFRTFDAERRVHPAHGFVDGDLVESFLDLDRGTMQAVVKAMNNDGGWDIETHAKSKDIDDDNDGNIASENNIVLLVEDVLAMVEEMTMFH